MAYIQNTAFQPRFTNREFDETLNITGVYNNDSDAVEACSAGTLCVESSQYPNQGYTGVNNENAWIMKAAAALGNDPIYACNTYDVNEVEDPVTGAIYRVGTNTLGLPAIKGRPTTFTRIDFDGNKIYRFGIGNFSTTITAGMVYVTALSSGLLVPTATAPATSGQKYFKIIGQGNFTQGAYSGFGYVDVQAKIAD